MCRGDVLKTVSAQKALKIGFEDTINVFCTDGSNVATRSHRARNYPVALSVSHILSKRSDRVPYRQVLMTTPDDADKYRLYSLPLTSATGVLSLSF